MSYARIKKDPVYNLKEKYLKISSLLIYSYDLIQFFLNKIHFYFACCCIM